jgi:hypothetical protein
VFLTEGSYSTKDRVEALFIFQCHVLAKALGNSGSFFRLERLTELAERIALLNSAAKRND